MQVSSRKRNRIHAVIAITWAMAIAPSAMAKDVGTHFLVEPYSGVTFNQGFGMENAVALESGVLLGVGGKLKGFPPRFYLYFRVSESMFGDDDVSISSRDANGTVCRSYTRIAGGLRTVIPLFWSLRLNLEIGGGSLFSRNQYQEPGVDVSYNEDFGSFEMGVGLNWRLFNWLSVGIMYDYTMVAPKKSGDLIAKILGEMGNGSNLRWSHLNATIGFHF